MSFWVVLGITFCVGLGWFQFQKETPPNPPQAGGKGPLISEPPPPPIRVTVIETIRNSATVLVYLGEPEADLWLRAKSEGKSLMLSAGDFKKQLTFECEIVISHSEYINHAREAGPALILEVLFNVDDL